MSRREFLTAAGGAVAFASGLPAFGKPPRRKPNVVFVLADDLGWMDTSLYGSKYYETPNIDKLATRGMMFTQAYAANPLCSPTRASIMTGLYPARIGITSAVCHIPEVSTEETVAARPRPWCKCLECISASRLKPDYYTLAEALKDAGYATGHFGKWHLGREPYDPLHQGFDKDVPHWFGPGPAGSYIAPWKFPPDLRFQGKDGEHIEDRMAEEAVKFINDNKDRPFYLNYWCFSVHSPHGAKKELIEKYRAKADPKSPQRNPVYGAMVESLDDAVGRLMRALDENGAADNTIVVFFSDNGGVIHLDVDGAPVTSNAPLRGGKATMYEGGTREDCIVVWPGTVRPGSKSDALIQSIDFYPTILDMLGLKPRPGQRFDGESIVPVLKGDGKLRRDAVYCYFPHYIPATGAVPSVYVRKGDWKLIRLFHQGKDFAHDYELYNLRNDLGEMVNLASKHPDRLRELDAMIDKFLKDTRAVLPKPNPSYDPNAVPRDRP